MSTYQDNGASELGLGTKAAIGINEIDNREDPRGYRQNYVEALNRRERGEADDIEVAQARDAYVLDLMINGPRDTISPSDKAEAIEHVLTQSDTE